VDKSTLWKRVRKVAGIDGGKHEALHFPVDVVPGEESKETLGQTANVIFTTHQKAVEAIPMLHAHTYKGALLSCVLKKRIETSGSATGGDKDGSGKANRAGRLIIRNLTWNTTETDLRKKFLPFGPILGINLPTVASKLPHKDPSKPAPPPRARGFAFVWFLSKKDAERAIEELNDKELNERKITVDWAVSKDKYEEAKKEEGAGDSKEKDKMEVDVDDKEAVEAVLAGEKSDDQDEEEGEDEDVDMEGGDEEAEDEEEEKPVKPVLPAVEEGSTLFIRNVPFEVTEEELRTL
jgi:nucleolar protein 4